ncbi:unnamed protein product [Lymnaea stagnalis]|uniref:Uncharacterized protein n=1 Tax=Lymnaea stagnalis TaxID=6523 RepID=A0AAV2HAQ6_LYMST
MDEPTHKELVKNVWVNFLAIFPLSEDANRICSLAKDEVMTAVIEGLPEDKDNFGGSRNLRSDSKSLKDLFFHCQNSIEENAESLTTKIRVLRSETVPKKDVFVCGSIPTKMDADVYNTLNAQSCQLICNQSFRFPLCKQWLDQMDKPGKDFINNLPTPSRILRQERWELPPFSPLVTSSTPSSTGSRPPLPNLTSTPKTTNESLRENPVVKKLFASELKADE